MGVNKLVSTCRTYKINPRNLDFIYFFQLANTLSFLVNLSIRTSSTVYTNLQDNFKLNLIESYIESSF